jgi:hypothetical protein
MTTAIYLLAIPTAVLLVSGTALLALILWIAQGESDVNGDPELDSTGTRHP